MWPKIFVCIFSIFLLKVKFVHSSGRNEESKILLISAEYIPYDIISSTELNLTAFQILLNEGCVLPGIPLNNFGSSAEIHSAILSGSVFHHSSANKSHEFSCDQIIRSKISPHFEPLWLTNQRHGMKSGSFYWPDDFVAVNESRPYLTAGSNPTARNAYFDIERIYHWLLDPSITFLTIFIPPLPHSRYSNFVFNFVEYTDSFLSTLLSHVRKSPKLNASISIVFIGGTIAVNDQTANDFAVPIRETFKRWPSSAFGGHFTQGPVLEFWPTPGTFNARKFLQLNRS